MRRRLTVVIGRLLVVVATVVSALIPTRLDPIPEGTLIFIPEGHRSPRVKQRVPKHLEFLQGCMAQEREAIFRDGSLDESNLRRELHLLPERLLAKCLAQQPKPRRVA